MRTAAAVLFATLTLTLLACEEKTTSSAPAASTPAASAPVESASAPPPSSAPPATASATAKVPDAVAAQHVLVAYKGAKGAPKAVTRSKADAKKRAEEVMTKAKGGTDFSALVAEYSDDPGSKERMGSVGKFTREKMVKPFSDAAFALPVDGISEVVESDFGFHVIKRNQ
jgi:peptidyl-prolyl cis-trans isomerase NIMA-interacting 1